MYAKQPAASKIQSHHATLQTRDVAYARSIEGCVRIARLPVAYELTQKW